MKHNALPAAAAGRRDGTAELRWRHGKHVRDQGGELNQRGCNQVITFCYVITTFCHVIINIDLTLQICIGIY